MFSNTGSMFGNKSFGSTTSGGGLFGNTSSNTTGFGFGSTVQDPGPEGTTFPFEEVKGTDSMNKNGITRDISTKLMCITAMDKYKPRSLEELRVFDYIANRKGPQAGGTAFGQQASTGSSLFGQPQKPTSLFGSTTQQQSAFGSNTSSGFGSTTSAFGQAQKPAFGSATTGGSLFGSAQPAANTGSSLFGQPAKPAFGQTSTASTGGSLFGNKPAFGSTGASQTSTSLFGKPATSSVFGQPAATSSSTGFGFGSTTTTTQSSGFGFGSATTSTANAPFGAKPATGFSGFGTSTTGTTGGSLFGSTQQQQPATGGLFGNTAAKPAGGLFGSQPAGGTAPFGSTATSTGGLFGGSTAAKPAGSLFGSTTTSTGTLGFGAQQQQPQQTLLNQPASPPIVLGGGIDEAQLQRKLIEAQLGSMPYGDSPLFKGKASITTISPPAKLSTNEDPDIQAKLRQIASQSLMGNDTKSSLSSPIGKSNNESTRSAITSPQKSFSYKPIVPLPSLGFASGERSSLNLSLRRSPPKIAPSKNIFDSSSAISSPKTFDPSVLRSKNNVTKDNAKSEAVETPNEGRKNVAFAEAREGSNIQPVRLDLDNVNDSVTSVKTTGTTPQQPLKSILVTQESRKQRDEQRRSSTSAPDTPADKSIPPEENRIPINIDLLEAEGYYTEPSLRDLELMQHDGKVQIKSGLRIGRNGFGSVYFPGKFELSTLNFDKIIHFQAKEVTVYPDDATKPPVGIDLNRPAEISLEKIWPYVKEVKGIVTDPVEIEKLRFKNRLELACQRMNATFIDYKVKTGTWTFAVKHF